MSRGPGRIQSSILAQLKELGGKVQQNQLLWSLAEKNGSIEIGRKIYDEIYDGRISNAFKNTFSRALTNLVLNRTVHVSSVKLNDLDLMLRYYPYKTLRYEMLALRKRLLPIVKEFIKAIDEGHYHPTSYDGYKKFGLTDNERYVLDSLNEMDLDVYEEYKSKWGEIENEIVTVALTNSSTRNLWIKLIVKGRELFIEKYNPRHYYQERSVEVSRVRYSISFGTIVKDLSSCYASMSQSEILLLSKIEQFKNEVFRDNDIARAAVKSQLYRVAYFSRKGSVGLNPEFKLFMFRTCTDLIKSLPGHRDPPFTLHGLGEPTQYSPLMNRLIDGRILSDFRFLSYETS